MVNAWIKTEIFPQSHDTVFIVPSDGVETPSINVVSERVGQAIAGL
jgi:hypothetical protein